MPFAGSPVRSSAVASSRAPTSVHEASEEANESSEVEPEAEVEEADGETAVNSNSAASEAESATEDEEGSQKDEENVSEEPEAESPEAEGPGAESPEAEGKPVTKLGPSRHWGLLSLSNLRIQGVSPISEEGSDAEEGSVGSVAEDSTFSLNTTMSTKASAKINDAPKVNIAPPSLVCLSNSEEAEELIRKYDRRAGLYSILIGMLGYVLVLAMFGGFGYIAFHYGSQLAESSAGSAATQISWTSWGIAVACDVAFLEYLPIIIMKVFEKVTRGPIFSGLGSKTEYCHKWYEDYSDLVTLEMLQLNNSLEPLLDGVNAVNH